MSNVGPFWCERCKQFGKCTKWHDKRNGRLILTCKRCNTINSVWREYCDKCKDWTKHKWIMNKKEGFGELWCLKCKTVRSRR